MTFIFFNSQPIERYSSGDLNSQPMKGKEGTPLMGLNTIRLSGSTLDHFNTQLVQPEEKNIVNINRQFERQSKGNVTRFNGIRRFSIT